MVIETITVNPVVYFVYLLGSLFCISSILWVVYYTEYIKMKRYIKYTGQLEKYEQFTAKTKVE